MSQKVNINNIINTLRDTGVIDRNAKLNTKMDGTTEGLVYTLSVADEPKYVLKLDSPQNNTMVELMLLRYKHSPLLPRLLYTDPAKTFIVYTFLIGTTHHNRGSKRDWLTSLVTDLLNQYEVYPHTDKWGYWLEEPCQSWHAFIDQGVEYARNNVGNVLPIEDYFKVKALVDKMPKTGEHERYLLHGDCGVHNFVFNEKKLSGVIDPSTIVGPVRYDYLYAYCSSPDDLNLETLISTISLLNHMPVDRTQLIDEVIIQLYCRIGICLLHHREDLEEYLKAWDYWKAIASS